MKIWILRPKGYKTSVPEPWEPWFDKAFGFVIQADTEECARELAQTMGGDEIRYPDKLVWTDPNLATCEELIVEGPNHIIIIDFRSA